MLLGYGFFGILFLSLGLIFKAKYNLKVKMCTMETIGVIEDYIRGGVITGEPDKHWYPVISYKVDDKEVKKKVNVGASKKKYEIGDKVTIKYNPNNIDDFYVVEYNINKLSNIFIIVGIVVLFIGVILFVLL